MRILLIGLFSLVLAASVQWREDTEYRYLDSNGLPDHAMMVGITAWQQQVPLPQDFSGANAFRIPKKPVLAGKPVSAKTALFTGAIAVAINGVPIFNPIKNDGRTDTFLAGELDEFGGHCGRADDYHYHIAPLHLEKTASEPIGWALDGFALYGLKEPGGGLAMGLDEFNGHDHDSRGYHYHSTRTYPYVNGGMRGKVEIIDDSIWPQPRTDPVRPAGRPLRGARVVGFSHPSLNQFSIEYSMGEKRHFIRYSIDGNNRFSFVFEEDGAEPRTETYERRPRRDRKRP